MGDHPAWGSDLIITKHASLKLLKHKGNAARDVTVSEGRAETEAEKKRNKTAYR